MTDEETRTEADAHEPNHGTDAQDKPSGGALQKDNDPSLEEEGGLGEKTGASGGAAPTEGKSGKEEDLAADQRPHDHGKASGG